MSVETKSSEPVDINQTEPQEKKETEPGIEKTTDAEEVVAHEKIKEEQKVVASNTYVSSWKEPRPHLNIVFIGHVDASKSTTCGNILYLCNQMDERQVEKYQKEATENKCEIWFLTYIMDTNEEEKDRGQIVAVGRVRFELEVRRFAIFNALVRKANVPNMIQGVSQTDIEVSIISARNG